MKLSSQAVEQILHVIETFDRERGVPHDYVDLEMMLRKTEFHVQDDALVIGVATEEAKPLLLDDSLTAKDTYLDAARSWKD
jgi:hypothetical protein